MNKFRTLLPPGATTAERAQEQATTEQVTALNTDMATWVKNPDRCPAHLLPWLAWEFAVDFWHDDWPEIQKRQVIKSAAYVHQHRGTAGAVRRALRDIGYSTTVVEWWQETPKAAPYTFRIEIYSTESITQETYDQLHRLTNRAKNLRSFLSKIDVITHIGTECLFYIAGAATVHITTDIRPETDNGILLNHH